MITTKELRQKYLDFFKSKNHAIIDGACLIPENDPSVLFTTAGMHPLVPYLLGEKHPAGTRLVNFQKCIRTGDIEEVGDNSHLTFFEMLGNWSLGDYFKKEAIEMSYEFLTSPDHLGLDKDKLAISVFAGDNDAPKDEESARVWKSLGVSEQRIAYLGKEDNWWGPAGQTGPCGPDSEMFYWTGDTPVPAKFDPEDGNWLEIWNNVFMEYNKTADGKYEPLANKNVDTGMGLERTTAILNGFNNVYEVDTIKPIYDKVYELASDKKNIKAIRIVVDHMRAAVMIMGDDMGVSPTNLDQGYVVRRLIRSAFSNAIKIGIKGKSIVDLVQLIINLNEDIYPEVRRNFNKILSDVAIEAVKFDRAIIEGTKYLEKVDLLTGEVLFRAVTTHGLPMVYIEDYYKDKNLKISEEAIKRFGVLFMEHQDLSRKGADKKFKGGLADSSEDTTALHTATHLLHTALRKVLGDHVAQKGSNITSERLRFDFSHPNKLTDEEKQAVEQIVNDAIETKIPISCEEMTVVEAKTAGALGLFNQKYGDKVKVYTIGEGNNIFSKEICGGPHAKNTGELGSFRIKKEQACSAGVRRIKAVLE